MVTDPSRKELTNTAYFLPSLGNFNYNIIYSAIFDEEAIMVTKANPHLSKGHCL